MKIRGLLILAAAMAGLSGALSAAADNTIDLPPTQPLSLLPPALINDGDPLPPGAQKEPIYNSPGFLGCSQGAIPSGSTFGFAVINVNNGGTVTATNPFGQNVSAEVVLKGATPNTAYMIYFNQDPSINPAPGEGCPTTPNGFLMTNGNGNGNAHDEVPIGSPTACNFWISAVGADGTVFRSVAAHYCS